MHPSVQFCSEAPYFAFSAGEQVSYRSGWVCQVSAWGFPYHSYIIYIILYYIYYIIELAFIDAADAWTGLSSMINPKPFSLSACSRLVPCTENSCVWCCCKPLHIIPMSTSHYLDQRVVQHVNVCGPQPDTITVGRSEYLAHHLQGEGKKYFLMLPG